jgi:hypothetical protein
VTDHDADRRGVEMRTFGEKHVAHAERANTCLRARAVLVLTAPAWLPVSDLSSVRQPRWPSVRGRFDEPEAGQSRSLSRGEGRRVQLSPISLAPDGSWRTLPILDRRIGSRAA